MKQIIQKTILGSAVLMLFATPVVLAKENGSASRPGPDAPTATLSERPATTAPSMVATERQRQLETELRNQLDLKQQERQASAMTKRDDAKAAMQEKLDDAKKKACEKHVATINRLQDVMNKRRQNTLDRITKISDAVQSFYIDKQLTVTNYADLLAKVNAAKVVADSALQAQQQIPALDCSGDHPRADVTDFKDKRATAIDAVRAYRDAVKELARAIKTAAEAASNAATTPTPSPAAEGGVQ